jgi:hypothetical protein
MPDRSRLHELVDTLPEAALNVAQGALEHFQTWPPQEPPQVRALREGSIENMERATRPGSGGGSGGGGIYRFGPGLRVEYRHQGYSYWDGDTVVVETHRFHAGHELEIEERLRLADSGTKLVYGHTITGPGVTADAREIVFDVGKE